jgi:hypothetical protein
MRVLLRIPLFNVREADFKPVPLAEFVHSDTKPSEKRISAMLLVSEKWREYYI